MVDKFLFFQEGTDALEFSDFFGVMEQDAIGTDVEMIEAAFAQFTAKLRFVRTVKFLNVKNEFVEIERIIIEFAQFNLPRADFPDVVKHMFQLVEINQGAFDLIEVHLLDF